MFQREVAERIVAAPGSSPMAVSASWPGGARWRRSSSTCRRKPSGRRRRSLPPSSIWNRAPNRSRRTAKAAFAGDAARLRPAPQNAAPEPEAARRPGAAGRCRHRRVAEFARKRFRSRNSAGWRMRGPRALRLEAHRSAVFSLSVHELEQARAAVAAQPLGLDDRLHGSKARSRSSLTMT
jgi:hypothetical protein